MSASGLHIYTCTRNTHKHKNAAAYACKKKRRFKVNHFTGSLFHSLSLALPIDNTHNTQPANLPWNLFATIQDVYLPFQGVVLAGDLSSLWPHLRVETIALPENLASMQEFLWRNLLKGWCRIDTKSRLARHQVGSKL